MSVLFNMELTLFMKEKIKKIIDFWLPSIIVFVLMYGIGRYVICFAHVPTESMSHTIEPGQMTVGLRVYGKQKENFERGDIVVFETEDYMIADEKLNGCYYIKRIIGLPGDTVEIRNGETLVNGKKFNDEEWIAEKPQTDMPVVTVPSNAYFVMGDNRNHSFDSRFWTNPFVPVENVIGNVWKIL